MISIGVQKALLLHQLMIEQTGGELGVRDIGLLEAPLPPVALRLTGNNCFRQNKKRLRAYVWD